MGRHFGAVSQFGHVVLQASRLRSAAETAAPQTRTLLVLEPFCRFPADFGDIG